MHNLLSSIDSPRLPHIHFIEAWESHHQLVYRTCITWLRGRRDDADEAYSRVAVQAFQKWPAAISGPDHAKAWLLTVARHVCIDLYRERRNRREVSLDTDLGDRDEQGGALMPLAPDPEHSYVAREQQTRVRGMIAALPFRLRRAAELHFIREVPYREIARQLAISEVNVRKRIQQARERLRLAAEGTPGSPEKPPSDEEEGRDDDAAPEALYAAIVETDAGYERDVEIVLPLRAPLSRRRIERIEIYIREHPRGWMKRLELARALASQGLWRDAIAHYLFVLTKQPYPIRPWLELGTILTALGRDDEAETIYAKGAEETRRDADRTHLHALEQASRDAGDAACTTMSVAIREAEGDWRHLRAHGELCLRNGRPVDALESLEKCLALHPDDPLAPVLCHDALSAMGRRVAARKQLVAAFEKHPGNALILERLIVDRCRARAFRQKAAWVDELFASLAKAHAGRAATHAAAAEMLLARGKTAEAERTMSAYVDVHRRHAGAWRMLARVRADIGATRAAVAAAFTGLHFDAGDREAWLEVARLLTSTTMVSSARRTVTRIATSFRSDPVLLGAASALALTAGRREQALELCSSAISLQPRLPQLHFILGRILAELDRDGDAIAALLEGWALIPGDDSDRDAAGAALDLARSYHRLGAAEEHLAWSRIALIRATALNDVDPSVSHFLRGEALELLGSPEEALAAYRGAIDHFVVHPYRPAAGEAVRRLARHMFNARTTK